MDGLKVLNTATTCDLVRQLIDMDLIEEELESAVKIAKNDIKMKYDILDEDITYVAYSKLGGQDKTEIKRRLMMFILIVISEMNAHCIGIIDGIKHDFETTGDTKRDLEEIFSRLDKITDARNVLRIRNLINELESRKEDDEKELIIIAETLQALASYIFQKIKSF